MASIDFSLFLQRYTPKIVHVLISTFLELTLITLHFFNCILFFLITKYASLCGLQTPCIICSSSLLRIPFDTIICNDHITRTSQPKRVQRKIRNRKDTSGFIYVIYGPPWRVVQYAKNGNAIDKIIKRESGKDCCVVGEEEDHKPDFVDDNLLGTMNSRCIIDEERLAPVQSVKPNHDQRKFSRKGSFEDINTAGDGKTKLKNEARGATSSENYFTRKDHAGDHSNHSLNAHSYSSLSDIIAIEAKSSSNIFTRSESPSPKHNDELEEQETKKRSLSCKSLESSLVKRNKENNKRGSLHNRDINSNSCKSMFEITPFETSSIVNPDIASEPVSKKHDKIVPSEVKGFEEEIKGEDLIKLNASSEKLEEERCSILNQLQQRLLIVQKKEEPSENVTEEEKLDLQPDYKSLSDFFNREMNYSTTDLVSLGTIEYNQRRNGNSKMKSTLPSLHEYNLEKGVDNSDQVRNLDAGVKEDDNSVIKKEWISSMKG